MMTLVGPGLEDPHTECVLVVHAMGDKEFKLLRERNSLSSFVTSIPRSVQGALSVYARRRNPDGSIEKTTDRIQVEAVGEALLTDSAEAFMMANKDGYFVMGALCEGQSSNPEYACWGPDAMEPVVWDASGDKDSSESVLQRSASAQGEHLTAESLIGETGGSPQTLLLLCSSGDHDAVTTLLDTYGKESIDTTSATGRTPLDMALLNGHTKVASILLKEGASPSSETLFLAAAVSDAALVDVIIRKHPGVDLWHMDDDYGTALHMAAALGNAEIVKSLLNFAKDRNELGKTNVENNAGDTPLLQAAAAGSLIAAAIQHMLRVTLVSRTAISLTCIVQLPA